MIPFSDSDGLRLELISDKHRVEIDFWKEPPIPEGHALRGFHGITLLVPEIQPSAHLLNEILMFTMISQERDRRRFIAASDSMG